MIEIQPTSIEIKTDLYRDVSDDARARRGHALIVQSHGFLADLRLQGMQLRLGLVASRFRLIQGVFADHLRVIRPWLRSYSFCAHSSSAVWRVNLHQGSSLGDAGAGTHRWR